MVLTAVGASGIQPQRNRAMRTGAGVAIGSPAGGGSGPPGDACPGPQDSNVLLLTRRAVFRRRASPRRRGRPVWDAETVEPGHRVRGSEQSHGLACSCDRRWSRERVLPGDVAVSLTGMRSSPVITWCVRGRLAADRAAMAGGWIALRLFAGAGSRNPDYGPHGWLNRESPPSIVGPGGTRSHEHATDANRIRLAPTSVRRQSPGAFDSTVIPAPAPDWHDGRLG